MNTHKLADLFKSYFHLEDSIEYEDLDHLNCIVSSSITIWLFSNNPPEIYKYYRSFRKIKHDKSLFKLCNSIGELYNKTPTTVYVEYIRNEHYTIIMYMEYDNRIYHIATLYCENLPIQFKQLSYTEFLMEMNSYE